MNALTEQNFEEVVSKGDVVVDFWAPWCAPCRLFAPTFEQVSAEESEITFAKVDTDAQGAIAQQAGIKGIPTLIFFRDGKEIARQTGAMQKAQFKQKLKEVFG